MSEFCVVNKQQKVNNKIQFITLAILLLVGSTNAKNMNTKNKTNAEGQVVKHGKLVYSEITINASPEKVWKIFTDFDAYSTWNPFIRSFKGKPAVGDHVEARLQVPGKKAMTFKPVVLQYQPNKELRWIGKFMVSRVFDGEHTFKLRDNGDGTTTFIQYENFRGILIPFMTKMLDEQTLSGFKLMNEKLKERVEAL